MKKIIRGLSGALLGAAALTALPVPASAYEDAGGFCDETETYVVCCSTNDQNQIINCNFMKKPS